MPRANRRLKKTNARTIDGKRVVLYLRYSSHMQDDSWSLEAQQRILEQYAHDHGWTIVAVFTDEARSAKDDRRPGFQEMLSYVRTGKADRILVYKLDRFSRNLRILLEYVEELETRGIGLVCAAQPIDTSDPMTGKLILVLLGVLAEMYLISLSEETIRGKRERAEQGLWLGMVPWAYTMADDPHLPPQVDTAKAWLWQAAADLYDPAPPRSRPDNLPEARTWSEVAAWLNGQGARMQSRFQGKKRWQTERNPHGLMLEDTVADMLQNLFYAGFIVYDDPDTGEQLLFPGKHDPLTDRAQIERIRAKSRRRLSLHERPQPVPRIYAANGIVSCAGCGHALNIIHSPGGARYTCKAARRGTPCRSRCHSIKVVELDRLLDQLIGTLTLPPSWRDEILAAMQQDSPRADRLRRRAELRARLARLHDRYEVDASMTKEGYRAKVATIQAEIEALADPTEADVISAAETIESLADLWSLPSGQAEPPALDVDATIRSTWNDHMSERRAFLQMAFERITVDLDGKALTDAALRPAFLPLAALLPQGLISADVPTEPAPSVRRERRMKLGEIMP